jgi:hypothetical protein
MRFDEIQINDFIALIENAKLHTLVLPNEFHVIIVTGKGLDIAGVHTIPPDGMRNTLKIENGALFGGTFDAWDYVRFASKEDFLSTKRALKILNITLSQYGRIALSASYADGPRVFEGLREEIELNSFCIPNYAIAAAKVALSLIRDDLHASLVPPWVHNSEPARLYMKLMMSFPPGGFGLKETDFRPMVTDADPSGVSETVSNLNASRLALQSALAESGEAEWATSETQAILKKYGVAISFCGFLPNLDHGLLEEVILNRLKLLDRCALPDFYQLLFYRKVSTSLTPSGYDHLQWVLRNHLSLWKEADEILQSYKAKVLSHSRWCGVDHFAGVLPEPVLTPTFNTVALRKLGLAKWPND